MPSTQVSVWYGCVLRGDLNSIKVGSFSNIQERTVVHAARCELCSRSIYLLVTTNGVH